jgi:hypothetical protein
MKQTFDSKTYHWQGEVDYRLHPQLYRVGKGEQGVLLCEPYKSEILPHWRFKTPEIASKSSSEIYQLFLNYLEQGDFVGADMARKFLQMGFTRARRYTNYKGGRKYETESGMQLPKGTGDPDKAISADIFYHKWKEAEANPTYARMKQNWQEQYG